MPEVLADSGGSVGAGEAKAGVGNVPVAPRRRRSIRTRPQRAGLLVWSLRVTLLLAVLALWQFLPEIPWLRSKSPVFDPFFVSSPQRIIERLGELAQGSHGQPQVWSYLWETLKGTLLGVIIGTVLGALFGLLLSNSRALQAVLSPYITFVNAMPRIALVPLFVIISGPTLTASVLTAVTVVFFLVFYNAYAGGISVPTETVENARLLGATSGEIMRQVRLPYVLVWTFTSIPNAISFGLVAVVTAEILTGRIGMGQLLFTSISSVDSTLTFCVIVILSIVGVGLVTVSDALQRRVLHWWGN
jgi:NitT/TauT family transport system permease protein